MTFAMTRRGSLAALACAGAAAATPALAQTRAPEADRTAIKAMAGDYHVRFNFQETTAYVPDYTPRTPTQSGGYESVRVIADEPGLIVLQHLLVAEHEGRTFIIKHWRQDWIYQPRQVLVYEQLNTWALASVSSAERRGAWAQTVWQTDDSPRYGGVGRWMHENGRSVWVSGASLRPLARRDAIRQPPYNRYACINRHAITPTGWVHEQDNDKLGERDGRTVTFVHEDGFNTYNHFNEYPVAAADAYWSATQAYWAGVRAAWDAAVVRGRGRIWVEEEAQNGAVTGPVLMGLADQIHAGEIETAPALAQAQAEILRATSAG